MLKTWGRKATEDLNIDSVWEQISNRYQMNKAIPNAEERKVPKDVVHYVSTEIKEGSYTVTVPLVEGLKEDGKGGLQPAEGSGESLDALYADCGWNIIRKVQKINDKGVELESAKYLQKAMTASTNIKDWFAADKDYSCQRALIEGADRYLTEDVYWQDYKEHPTALFKRAIHPNIAYRNMASPITRSNVYSNDMNAIVNALAAWLGPNDGFNLAALDRAIEYADRKVASLNWNAGGRKMQWVLLISPLQASQLANDQIWINLMATAEKRGPENRAISGILGERNGALIIVDKRSPILNLESKEFEYVTPMSAYVSDDFYGLGKLNRSVKGAAGQATGTCEIVRILGKGALGIPKIRDLTFKETSKDFGHQKELCGEIAMGHNRMDFTGKTKEGEERKKNISSALYFTATPIITY
jgi:hypothetical protein